MKEKSQDWGTFDITTDQYSSRSVKAVETKERLTNITDYKKLKYKKLNAIWDSR